MYRFFHKIHHKHIHPISISLFYHHPLDAFLSISLPNLIVLSILPYISFYQFNLILIYKAHIEIIGHCGKKLYPFSSFTQLPWLAKYLNIELYAEDHDLHHSLNNCNYGKRFSLWDKVFNTYKNAREYNLKNI